VLAMSWALVLDPAPGGSRLQFRMRITTLGRRVPRAVAAAGGLADWVTVALLERGLAERVSAAGR
jgi:hypothetical protein